MPWRLLQYIKRHGSRITQTAELKYTSTRPLGMLCYPQAYNFASTFYYAWNIWVANVCICRFLIRTTSLKWQCSATYKSNTMVSKTWANGIKSLTCEASVVSSTSTNICLLCGPSYSASIITAAPYLQPVDLTHCWIALLKGRVLFFTSWNVALGGNMQWVCQRRNAIHYHVNHSAYASHPNKLCVYSLAHEGVIAPRCLYLQVDVICVCC